MSERARKATKKATQAKKAQGPVSEPKQRKGLNMGFLFLVFIFLACTGVFMLIQHQCAVRADLKMRKLESKISDEKSKQESLRLNLARLKSPGRVARIATDELGLADPGGVIYLKYSRDAAGNMVTQSTFEELAAPEPVARAEEQSKPVAKDSNAEEGAIEETGAETSGTSR